MITSEGISIKKDGQNMTNPTSQKALSLLSHPFSLSAMALLMLNDHLFRRMWPSWWTGKLGDFAWLFFMPFACAVALAWLIPPKWKPQPKVVAALAFLLPAGVFALAKTWPWFHEGVVELSGAAFRMPVAWRRDPGDLVALASTGLAAWFWRREPGTQRLRISPGWAALPLAAWLTVANSAAPEMGVRCLAVQDGALTAAATYQSFQSSDGGLTWQPDAQISGTVGCAQNVAGNTVVDPQRPGIVYRFEPGEAIERSVDGGQTWRQSYSLIPPSEAEQAFYIRRGYNGIYDPGPLDALVDPNSGNALFAMGYEGVLVYQSDQDTWIWAPAGSFNRVELGWLDYGDQMLSLLLGEMLLGALFGVLSASTLAPRARRSWPRVLIISIAWLLWSLPAFLFPPALTYAGYGSGLVAISILAAAALILPLGIDAALGIGRESPRSFVFYGMVVLVNTVLFFFPFLLWVTNLLPLYTLALYLALALGTAALWVQYRRASRIPDQAIEADPDRRRTALVIYVVILIVLSLVRAWLFSFGAA
jgi:hypothetical protein